MINLTIHGIGTPSRPLEDGEDRVWLTEDTIKVILDELVKYREYTVTVDDANQSDVEIVLPALLSRGLKAIFFIPAGLLGQKGYLRREEVGALFEAHMEIGSHGMFHRDWRTLSHRELNVEINESKRILQDIIGQEIKNASCPYGSYDRSVLGYLSNAGFEKVYTSDRGRAQSKWWVQPRNSLHNTDDSRTLAMIMTQPHSLRESFVSYTKRFVKRWR